MKEKKQLILVRHGETDWNVTGRRNSFTDIPLTERGRNQAAEVAGYLKLTFPDATLWSSPAKRAQETAEVISNALGTAFQNMPDAVEINFGPFEGKTMAELAVEPEASQYRAWETGRPVYGVESLDEVASRAKLVHEEIMSSSTSNRSILVAHGAFIRVLICAVALNVPPTVYPRIVIDNASVSVLTVTHARVRLSQLNNRCYLSRE